MTKIDSPDVRTGIQIEVKEGVDLGGKPGLKLSLTGWAPRADFAIYALDMNGDSVPLVPAEAEQAADGQGRATVAIPYETPGLHPGSWIIDVSGKDADRAERLLIPRVVRGKHSWRLDFKAARDWDAKYMREASSPPG